MNVIFSVFIVSAVAMTIAWLQQQKTQNAGIVDIIWSMGMLFAGFFYAYNGTGDTSLRMVLALITGCWFLRLTTHLYSRFLREPEDGRYAFLRRYFGAKASVSFLLFFQLQAGFIVLLSLPFWAVAQNTNPKPVLVIVAILLVIAAGYGEALADRQLAIFRSNPDNRGFTCRNGLWRYSRHPNYFFEWLHWFAYPLLGVGGVYQYYLWISPVLMFLFLYFFTGIPFTEQQALRSRGPDYQKYQQTTSLFIPMPPKSGDH